MDSSNFDGVVSAGIEEKDAEIRRLTKLLEDSRQEAYELRSRLQVAERCSEDYVAELEALHQDAHVKDIKHAAAIREMQEERSNALKDAEQKIENWEAEYQLVSERVAGLQKELLAKTANVGELTKESNESAALQHELEEALDALAALTAACKQHKELISVLQAEKKALVQQVESLEQEVQIYKEHLSISKAQLSAQIEEFKESQEHLAVIQTELSALKATPNVQSRGNSLFAEVEDKRQQMVKQYKLMAVKFNHMKTDYSTKCAEIVKMKKEKSILLDKLEIAEKEAKKHYNGFVENYEIRIKELQKTVADLKTDVKPVYINGNDAILKFAEHTVVNSRKEVDSLRDEMELRSALRLNEAAELLKTRGELAQARTDLRNFSRKIAELTTALKNHQVTDIPSPNLVPVSPEEEAPKASIPVKKMNAERKVEFGEKPLPEKFNLKKGIDKAIGFENLIDSQVNVDINSSADNKSRTGEPMGLVSQVSMNLYKSAGLSRSEVQPQELKCNPKAQIESQTSIEDTMYSEVSMEIESQTSIEDTMYSEVSMEIESQTSAEDTDAYTEVSMDLCDSVICKPERSPSSTVEDNIKKQSHEYLELTNYDETLEGANLADELGLHFKLGSDSDAVEQSFALRRKDASTVGSDETLEGARGVEKEKALERGSSDYFPALVLSPSSSDYYMSGMEEPTNQLHSSPDVSSESGNRHKDLSNSRALIARRVKYVPENLSCSNDLRESALRFSDAVTCAPEKLSNPWSVRSFASGLRTNLSPKKSEKTQLEVGLELSKYEVLPRSILKTLPDYRALENREERRKDLRFDEETEKIESDKQISVKEIFDKEISVKVDGIKVEENKENDDEKRPVRRRPRPKQNQPIIYMT